MDAPKGPATCKSLALNELAAEDSLFIVHRGLPRPRPLHREALRVRIRGGAERVLPRLGLRVPVAKDAIAERVDA